MNHSAKRIPLFLVILAFPGVLLTWYSGIKGDKGAVNHSAANGTVESLDQHVVCLVYHRFGNDRHPTTNIDTKLFRKHLQYLSDNNYQVLTFGKAVTKLRSGDLDNGKYVVITVDDGYKSFKKQAFPILERFGFNATLFVNTKQVGGSTYLDWQELKMLKKSGIEIGNHSHAHPHFLNKVSKSRIKDYFTNDLKKAQEAFKKYLGYNPKLYAYPYGEYNPAMANILDKFGFKAAAAQHSGVLYKNSNFFGIPRFPMTGRFAKMESFKRKISMKALPVKGESPQETIINENPPTLSLTFTGAEKVNLNNIQCFVSGDTACNIKKDLSADPPKIRFKASNPLKSRRVKYTITAPSKGNNQWHWYSKLWVQPDKGEYK